MFEIRRSTGPALAGSALALTMAFAASAVGQPLGGVETIRDCPDCPLLALLPAGSFTMGSDGGPPATAREMPARVVTLESPAALGVTEVTRAQFDRFVAATGHTVPAGCFGWDGNRFGPLADADWRSPGFAQGDDEPVVCVGWNDAVAYAQWLSAGTGLPYRLPTEAEWEYAARAGTGTERPWGDGVPCDHANLHDATGQALNGLGVDPVDCDDGYARTAPVGSFAANPFGLHDMLGNVFEWTADCWHDDYTEAPTDGTARVEAGCSRHALRGGAWKDDLGTVRAGTRVGLPADFRSQYFGFRIARDVP